MGIQERQKKYFKKIWLRKRTFYLPLFQIEYVSSLEKFRPKNNRITIETSIENFYSFFSPFSFFKSKQELRSSFKSTDNVLVAAAMNLCAIHHS